MAITYIGSASTPTTTDGSNAASPTVVDPAAVGTMYSGDLVVVVCRNRLTADTHAVSATGGQSWTKLTTYSDATGLLCTVTYFWCRFNGTWSTSPSFSHGGTNNSCLMLVFRPTAGANTWAKDVTEVAVNFAAPTTPFDVTLTGISTAANSVAIGSFSSRDDNTWTVTSGFTLSRSINNLSGSDGSDLTTYKLMPSGGATGDVVGRQTNVAGDTGVKYIVSFKEINAYELWTTAGAFSETGNDAKLLDDRKTLAAAGSYALASNGAILNKLIDYFMWTTAGVFVLNEMTRLVDKRFDTNTILTDPSNFPDGVIDVDGHLSITAAAAYGGSTYGLAAIIADTNHCRGNVLFSAPASNILETRFYVDPNSMTGNNYDVIVPCHIRSAFGGSQHVAAIRVDKRSTGFVFTLSSVNDVGTQVNTESGIKTDDWHCIEFEVIRATNDSSNDGYYQLWVDGSSIGSQNNVDNYHNFNGISGISIGGITRTGIIAGTMYLDELIVNDDGSEIGPYSSNVHSILAYGRAVLEATGELSEASAGGILLKNGRILGTNGDYTLTGNNAILTKGGGLTNYELWITAGTFAETGSNGILFYNRQVRTSIGGFILTESDAYLLRELKALAAAGVFVETGNIAYLLRAMKVLAAAGAFTESGNNAILLMAHKVFTTSGAFVLTGNNVILTYTVVGVYILQTITGAFALAESNARLLEGRKIFTAAGGYSVAADPAILLRVMLILASKGIFSLTGMDAKLLYSSEKTPGRVAGTDSSIWAVVGSDQSIPIIVGVDALVGDVTGGDSDHG